MHNILLHYCIIVCRFADFVTRCFNIIYFLRVKLRRRRLGDSPNTRRLFITFINENTSRVFENNRQFLILSAETHVSLELPRVPRTRDEIWIFRDVTWRIARRHVVQFQVIWRFSFSVTRDDPRQRSPLFRAKDKLDVLNLRVASIKQRYYGLVHIVSYHAFVPLLRARLRESEQSSRREEVSVRERDGAKFVSIIARVAGGKGRRFRGTRKFCESSWEAIEDETKWTG